MTKRLVEVFTAGCPLCDETVKLVRELACSNCLTFTVISYNALTIKLSA